MGTFTVPASLIDFVRHATFTFKQAQQESIARVTP